MKTNCGSSPNSITTNTDLVENKITRAGFKEEAGGKDITTAAKIILIEFSDLKIKKQTITKFKIMKKSTTLIEVINNHAIRCDYCTDYIKIGDGHIHIEPLKKYYHPDC